METATGLARAMQSAELVLNSLADGAYITDTDRRIVFWNKAAERITGWSADDVVGRCCRDNILIHVDKDGHSLCGCEHCPLHRSILTGTPCEEPVVVHAQTRRGTRIQVEVTVAPLRDPEGGVVGGIELFRDMSHEEQDTLRAVLIQRSMLGGDGGGPDAEVEACYIPREIIGGDFYRIDRTDGGLALFLADVPGHGMAAALFTALLHSLWDEFRSSWNDPAALLSHLNGRLMPLAGESGYFATATAAFFDPARERALIARAGHPSALHFARAARFAGGRSGLALGMLPRPGYVNEEQPWARGDTLLFCTDGAFEICNTAAEELGPEGLLRLVVGIRDEHGGDIPLTVVEERLLCYSGYIRLPDDLTLVKVRRK